MPKGKVCCKAKVLLLTAVGFLATFPAMAALSSSQLVELVQKAKILSPDYKIQSLISGQEAFFSTYRNPKATDKDCKIDSVLVGKTVMGADPTIKRVKMRFYDTSNVSRYREISVREGDVKAFASRQMTPDALLASIEIINGEMQSATSSMRSQPYRDIASSSEPAEGPYKGERLQMMGRIHALKDRGVDVQSLQDQMLRIEDAARRGQHTLVTTGINFLNRCLNGEEEKYNAAQRGHLTGSGGATQMAQAQRAAAELGELAPLPGMAFPRRYAIARRVKDLQDSGHIVDQYTRLLREIEELAAGGDESRLKAKLRYAEHMLGLPSFSQ
jgi:hypothetical protein